jgi:hypothetical protein
MFCQLFPNSIRMISQQSGNKTAELYGYSPYSSAVQSKVSRSGHTLTILLFWTRVPAA